jgi:hypothetical protein
MGINKRMGGDGDMRREREKRGLLAHSWKAAESRKRFMALRQETSEKVSDGEQLKYFLLYSRAGVATTFCFAVLLFISGVTV